MSYIFISYSKKDIEFARYICQLIKEAGIEVWMDENPDPGEDWVKTIEKVIEDCGAILLIMSPHSEESRWVKRELLLADSYDQRIFPVLLAGRLWPRFNEYYDMTEGLKAALPDRLRYMLLKYVSDATVTAPLRPPEMLFMPPDEAVLPAKPKPATTENPWNWQLIALGVIGLLMVIGLLVVLTN